MSLIAEADMGLEINGRVTELPKYRLERVQVASLSVDYAPPHGQGYARPLSQGRIAKLRRDWDPLAVTPIIISRRDNGLWVIDGNHRRVVAFDKGMLQLPAMVHTNLTREQEADLYTKIATVYPQTPATRFNSKLVAGDRAARAIVKIVESHGLELDLSGGRHRDGVIQAIARVEWIYARGGEAGLNWVLRIVNEAFDGTRDALSEMVLEGIFGFWLRYADVVRTEFLIDRLQAAGTMALDDRAASIFRRYETTPGNSVGRAMMEMYSQHAPTNVKKLGPWIERVTGPSLQMTYNSARFTTHAFKTADEPAPQQLGIRG